MDRALPSSKEKARALPPRFFRSQFPVPVYSIEVEICSLSLFCVIGWVQNLASSMPNAVAAIELNCIGFSFIEGND
jgi:hypothetical protein